MKSSATGRTAARGRSGSRKYSSTSTKSPSMRPCRRRGLTSEKGDLTIGVQFFLDHITGPEDLLFILIHERNHLILRRLYPDVMPGFDYPREVFNFAEDAYVNAIGRRQVASTLPERFYQPARGNSSSPRSTASIDWTLFRVGGNGTQQLPQARPRRPLSPEPGPASGVGGSGVGAVGVFRVTGSGWTWSASGTSEKRTKKLKTEKWLQTSGTGESEEGTAAEEVPAASADTDGTDAPDSR